MPYRIDLPDPPDDALDRLVEHGALDVEEVPGGLAAIMPDRVEAATVARALGVDSVVVSPARGRDDGSVWILSPRPVRVGRFTLVPSPLPARPGDLQLCDSPAFGTGLHATTALCLEALEAMMDVEVPGRMLDVGTGSGVLAVAALMAGVPRVAGLDIDASALSAARENARLNGVGARLNLVRGGPEAVDGAWPLVIANIQAAPLMEMAPAIVPRVARGGRLVLAGIPWSVTAEVEQAYKRFGMRRLGSETREGWTALMLQGAR